MARETQNLHIKNRKLEFSYAGHGEKTAKTLKTYI